MNVLVQNGQSVQVLDLASLIGALAGDGIVEGCGVSTSSRTLYVEIASGTAYVGGETVDVEFTEEPIDPGEGGGLDRRDVVSIDDGGNVVITKGTPAEPKPDEGDPDYEGHERFEHYQPTPPDTYPGVAIAEIYMSAESTSLDTADIRNLRQDSEISIHTINTEQLAAGSIDVEDLGISTLDVEDEATIETLTVNNGGTVDSITVENTATIATADVSSLEGLASSAISSLVGEGLFVEGGVLNADVSDDSGGSGGMTFSEGGIRMAHGEVRYLHQPFQVPADHTIEIYRAGVGQHNDIGDPPNALEIQLYDVDDEQALYALNERSVVGEPLDTISGAGGQNVVTRLVNSTNAMQTVGGFLDWDVRP